MLDVTELIESDHALLRRRFAALDDAHGTEALTVLWGELGTLLDAHAACEEEVFYPALLSKGSDGGEETRDAIDDHNKIRDAVREAAKHDVGSDPWWEAVGTARTENSDHIGEEEREALPDFRKHAKLDTRAELAVAWTRWHTEHFKANHVSTSDKKVDAYLDQHA